MGWFDLMRAHRAARESRWEGQTRPMTPGHGGDVRQLGRATVGPEGRETARPHPRMGG